MRWSSETPGECSVRALEAKDEAAGHQPRKYDRY